MTKILLLLISFPLLLFTSTANPSDDKALIYGRIMSTDAEALAGANVYLKDTRLGTAATTEGNFAISDIPPGDYTLVVSFVGYRTVQQPVSLGAGDQKSVIIQMERFYDMPQIELIGKKPQRLDRVPGSAAVITQEVIVNTAPVSGHEVFRRIAGVHAVEEEGVGLRANIGIRGLDPSKSRSVLMLEDGIPVALAPYGEPEMYYTPAMDRMAGVEVVKGSGSILFGPQTFGGVVNYITADPPSVPTASLHLRGGMGGFFTGRIGYGDTIGNTGYNVTYLRKQGDEVGLLDYAVNDISTKIKMMTGERSVLGIKLGLYDETSNSTYVGLTQRMYDDGGFDFTHLSPDDVLDVRRYSGSVTHDYFISNNVTLRTTAFGYTTTRNWSRQDFDNVQNPDRDYVRIVGNPDVPGGAIYFRDLTGNRNRQFEVAGVEPRISANFYLGNVRNELDAGLRYLYERAFEQRVNGNVLSPQSGVLRDDEIRTGHAFSAYAQNAFQVTENFSVSPGIRLEYFEYTRDIRRLGNENLDIKNTDRTTELIPGIGFNYRIADGTAVYGGVHRGYGPPRVKDAISAEGVSQELNAEKSWNIELGTRARLLDGLNVEFTGFYLDFSNQIIPVSEAAGGAGSPGASLVNGGSTEHLGLEAGINLDLKQILQTRYGLDLSSSLTLVRAEFSEDRFVNDADGNPVNVKGNTVPYAPEFIASTDLSVQLPLNLYLSLTGTYISKQYGDPLNLETGSLDGRQGPIPAHFVLDGLVRYHIPQLENASISVSVKNLLDERYIVSRRPQGIRVGLPRFVTAGIDWSF